MNYQNISKRIFWGIIALTLFVGANLQWLNAAGTKTLMRITIKDSHPETLFLELQKAHFDVLSGSLTTSTLEVIVSERELAQLKHRGLNITHIEHGRPLREIQKEQISPLALPTGYLSLNGIIAEMDSAAARYPSIAKKVDLTTKYNTPLTFEGRHLYALKISDNVDTTENEPAALLVSCHHARETITPVIALNAIKQLTTQYGSNQRVTSVVDNNEIWIVPVWNPDGYNEVFESDNMWRKNRRVFSLPDEIGVDLNRNYDMAWNGGCSGSTSITSNTYKGPSIESEAETQTMVRWTEDRNFAKVIDYHSRGREALYGYSSCETHAFQTWLSEEAFRLSENSGYGGQTRPPSASGEHYEWQLARGAYAFLVETHTQFQPPYSEAEAEAATVWPGFLSMLERAIPLSGRVIDANTGAEIIDAKIEILNTNFTNGETNQSGPFGSYHVFAPAGNYTIRFSATGYPSQDINVTLTATGAVVRDVKLTPAGYYSLTVTSSGQGSVSVVPQQGSYASGTVVTLTATADSGWVFDHWSGDLTGTANPDSITMNSHKTVTAHFRSTAAQYTLTVTPDPIDTGTITLDPPGGTYSSGTVVTITATPVSDWELDHWSGDLTGKANPATITMNSNKTVTGHFVEIGEGGGSEGSENTLSRFGLHRNNPNPFNPETYIRYYLKTTANVLLEVYNIRGQKIKTLINQQQSANSYTVKWNGKDNFGNSVSSGIYLYRIKIISGKEAFIESKKMFLLK